MKPNLKFLNKIITDRVYCGLDIGSQKIKAALLKVKENQMEFLGAFESEARGMKDNSVSDLSELSESIYYTVNELSKRTNEKVKDVELGIGSELIDVRMSSAVIPLLDGGNKVITNADIKKVNHQARLLGLRMEEEILHECPQFYQVDDINSALNPLGLYGRRLSVNSLLVLTNMNRLRNLVKAVNEAGFDVSHLFFSSFASSDVVLEEQDRQEGCLLVDVGSKATGVLGFKKGVMRFMEKIEVGGDHLTHAIARQLNIAFDLAEEIKRTYAVASTSDTRSDEEILVKRESNYIPIKREQIYLSMEPDLKCFVDGIRSALEKANMLDQMNRGIVMIGGASLMPGLIERIGQDLNMSVRMGKINIPTNRILGNAALFSSAVGLSLNGYRKTFRYLVAKQSEESFVKKLKFRINEIYQEYF